MPPKPTCSLPDCERPFYCRTYCKLHYDRWRKHGTTQLAERPIRYCSVDGCARVVHSKGICLNHHVRVMEINRRERRNEATRRALAASAEAEGWRPAMGFEDEYEVHPEGKVRRTTWKKGAKGGRILKPRLNPAGYFQVHLRRKNVTVHRLVALTFLGSPTGNAREVNHKNGIRTDNRRENLEWVTSSENNFHSWRVLRPARQHSEIG